jgi:hypothetical protein
MYNKKSLYTNHAHIANRDSRISPLPLQKEPGFPTIGASAPRTRM